MTGDDWQDSGLRVIGMFVSGDPLRSPGPHGEQLHDTSFMLWLNASEHDCSVTLPLNDWVQHGTVVLSTDPENTVGQPVKAGQTITVSAHSLVLLQETTS
jgi:glycogen operon protein